MSPLLWSLATAAIVVVSWIALKAMRPGGRARHLVLEEVRRHLRGGEIENHPRRGPQARGRLAELEVTVDLHHDPRRRQESPMWRVMAVGPVRASEPVEAHVGGWKGWIDPWMQREKGLAVPAAGGPAFDVYAHSPLALEHPVVVALRRQGPALGAGSLHVQRDFMRAEVRFDPQPEGNRGLFAFLDAMAEISGHQPARSAGNRVRVSIVRDTG